MGRKRNLLLVNPCPQEGSCFKNGDSKPSTIVCCPEASGRSYRHYENQCRKSDGTRWKTRRLESKGRRFRSWDCTIQNGRQQNSTQAFLGKHEDENHNWCCYFRHRHYYYNCLRHPDPGESFRGIHPKCDPKECVYLFLYHINHERIYFFKNLALEVRHFYHMTCRMNLCFCCSIIFRGYY